MAKYRRFRELNKKEKHKYLKLILYISLCLNLMFLGSSLNQIAIVFNDNRMPVLMYEGAYTDDGIHSYFTDIKEAKLYPLADIIKLGRIIFSIGDLVIAISFLLFLFMCIKLGILDYKTRVIK